MTLHFVKIPNSNNVVFHIPLRFQKSKRTESSYKKLMLFFLNMFASSNGIIAFLNKFQSPTESEISLKLNLGILDKVVYEFLTHIYNAFHRAYRNGEPCEDPLRVFIEYATNRGVFSPRAQIGVVIPICSRLRQFCHLGERCSGAHQDFISSGWSTETALSAVCIQYAKRGVCNNRSCPFAHISDDEFVRGLRKLNETRALTKND